MEEAISTDFRVSVNSLIKNNKEVIMSIADYILLIRNTFYSAAKYELIRTDTKKRSSDGLLNILLNLNPVVTREDIFEAIKGYKLALATTPDNSELRLKLGVSYLLLKDRRSALKEYKALKTLNPRMASELLYRWNVKTV